MPASICAHTAAGRSEGADIKLGVDDRGGHACLRVCGGPGNAHMSVVPSELLGHAEGWQPVAGSFEEQGGVTWFVPRFPLVPGLSYSLLIDGRESASIEVPALASTPSTDVVSIHPTAEEVPVNLLRTYVTFSAPMSEGYAARAVAVHRLDTGEPLDGVFLQMEPELWDSSRQRLTLLLDPGRIKRGLVPHLEAGYPLTQDVPVAVIVDPSFRDAAGQPLRAAAERRYRIGPAIRGRVDPLAWRLTAPAAESSEPLVVAFEDPLDRALLQRCLVVVDAAMAPVRGAATTDDGDRVWRFRPASPWQAGRYTLRVDARLEDVTGNSVHRVFDRDLDLPEHAPLDAHSVGVPLTIA
jgi:hypothetical protein